MSRYFCSVFLIVALATTYPVEDPVITVNVDLVNVYFTVWNMKGRLISNLDREHFAVYEDDRAQAITNFSRETDVPLTIALVIDSSGSVRDKLRFEREAAIEFLRRTLRRDRDRTAIITFNSSIELKQDFTDDLLLLSEAVRNTRAGGGTRLYDALKFTMQEKLSGREQRKVIILLTDGGDNSSRSSREDVLETAHHNNVTIYAISMNALGIPLHDSGHSDRVLRTLTTETGGKAFFPSKLKDLPSFFDKIAQELRLQYTIAYRSTNTTRDGAFRKLRIDVKNGRYSVRARSGYYAPHQITDLRREAP